MANSENLTQLLKAAQAGENHALDNLLPQIYEELRRLAAAHLSRERPNHTLQPTALVHEAYLRLIDQHSVDWRNRAHFFSIASETMRRILVNHALERRAQKRGGVNTGDARLSFEDVGEPGGIGGAPDAELIALDEALTRLATFDPQAARIVELKFFGGLTNEEIALTLETSDSTVKREWRSARAWLYTQLGTGDDKV